MKVIHTPSAPAAIGPYSQAILSGNTLYASGQIPVNPASSQVEAVDIAGQAEQVCLNVGAVLKEAQMGFENVVKTTCFLADMKDFAAFNEVYARYFISRPARSCVAVREIPKGVLCEVEIIAVRED